MVRVIHIDGEKPGTVLIGTDKVDCLLGTLVALVSFLTHSVSDESALGRRVCLVGHTVSVIEPSVVLIIESPYRCGVMGPVELIIAVIYSGLTHGASRCGIAGTDVKFSGKAAVPPFIMKGLGYEVLTFRYVSPVLPHMAGIRITSRKESCTAWRTYRTLGYGILKKNAVSREIIQYRCIDKSVAITAESVISLLIGTDP